MEHDTRDHDSANRFKRELMRLGLKRSDFAKEIGMDPNTVSRWATGWQKPSGIVWAYLRLRRSIAESISSQGGASHG